MKPAWIIEDFTGKNWDLGMQHMNKPKWLIENFTGDNGYEELIKEVRNQGMTCVVLDITNYFQLKPEVFEVGDCVVFQGSIQLFRKLRAELPATPIGWQTDPHYLCTTYWPHFQKFLFNDKHIFMSVAALKANKWWVYGSFAKEALIYIRPDGGDKKFTGRLLDLQDFDGFFADVVQCQSKDTDIVVVSTPKNIIWEGRFIVTNEKEILGHSTYKFQDQRTYIPSVPPKSIELTKKILDVGYYPDPVFTIDICQDSDNNFWLLEINSFTSAGTYEAKKENIVKRVSEIAIKEWEIVKNNKAT